MGSSISSYKKNFDSTVFGYTAASTVCIKLDNEDEDNVLFKPFLYGLSSSIPTTPIQDNSVNSRADSGFLLCEKDSRLWKDLVYVDQTYYSNNNSKPKPTKRKNIALGDALTFDKILYTTTQELYLSRRGFGLITPNIGLLSMIKKLDLSFNQLTEIPQEIGHLSQLECLLLSHNKITSIPDTICHLSQLIELNVSHNHIQQLTPFVGHLRSLQTLHLEHNEIKELTVCIDTLQNLNTLDLSHNPIKMLPAEITQLPFLRRLRLDGCPFVDSFEQTLAHDPPSLLETCARLVIKNEDQILGNKKKKRAKKLDTLTEPIIEYLASSKACSFCHGPYFDSYVSRGRWIEKSEMWVPLEYRLCSAHWSDEQDRVYAMFSSNNSSKKSTSLFKSKPNLPAIASKKIQLNIHRIQESIDQQESTLKRWKFKVRNNSSFLKKHRLS